MDWFKEMQEDSVRQTALFWRGRINAELCKVNEGHERIAYGAGGPPGRNPNIKVALLENIPRGDIAKYLAKIPSDVRAAAVEMWVRQIDDAETAVLNIHKEKLARHFQKGVEAGQLWLQTASFVAFERAAERHTVNEAMEEYMPDIELVELHGYSPLMEGDYGEIDEYFWGIFFKDADYRFEKDMAYDHVNNLVVEIPNNYFRSFEDGWTEVVREQWKVVLSKSPWSCKARQPEQGRRP